MLLNQINKAVDDAGSQLPPAESERWRNFEPDVMRFMDAGWVPFTSNQVAKFTMPLHLRVLQIYPCKSRI